MGRKMSSLPSEQKIQTYTDTVNVPHTVQPLCENIMDFASSIQSNFHEQPMNVFSASNC